MKALKAVKFYFPYSSLEIGPVNVGYLPLSRIKDRKSINQHAKLEKCATRIQAVVRGRKDRLVLGKMKKDKYLNTMAIRLQSAWRGSSIRSKIKKMHKRQRDVILAAAKRRQNFLKGVVQSKRMKAIALSNATKLQAIGRGYLGRKLANKMKEDKRQKDIKIHQELCCVRIQSICRMYLSRLLLLMKRNEARVLREQVQKDQQKARIKIQSAWRTAIVRHQIFNNLQEREILERKINNQREMASRLIGKMVRLSLFRINLCRRIEKRRSRANLAAKKIQRWHRRIVAEQMKIEKQQLLLLQNTRVLAAIVVQAATRTLLAKALRIRLQKEILQSETLRKAKALVITCWFRCNMAKAKLEQLRLERQKNHEVMAATCITAIWRGYLGRKCATLKLESKKSLWKQIWNEDYQTHFYYNELTGESRWSRPQQLLAFEPYRIICSNCNYYDAEVECATCEEFFCGICWDAVHCGGKRRHHTCKSLYTDHHGDPGSLGAVLH